MEWTGIAIAIVVAGYFIAKGIENSKNRELELKQKELESNPNYQKHLEIKGVEHSIEFNTEKLKEAESGLR